MNEKPTPDKKPLLAVGALGLLLLIAGAYALIKIGDENFTKTLGFFLFLFAALMGVVVFYLGGVIVTMQQKIDSIESKVYEEEMLHDQGL